jgi:hypothetical protein
VVAVSLRYARNVYTCPRDRSIRLAGPVKTMHMKGLDNPLLPILDMTGPELRLTKLRVR